MPAAIKIFQIVFPVFCIIGSGYVFARFKKISLEPVIEILLYLTVPALVISSLSKKKLVTHDLITVSLAAFAVVIGVGVISHVYLRVIDRRDLRGFYLPTMFMNSGNMSFPLALLAFGMDGLAVSVLYYIAVSLMVYSLGIYIAKGEGGISEIFKLPLIYASVTGITLNLVDMRLPEPLITTVDMLGAATIPIMQLSLGYRLYSTKLTQAGISIAGSVLRIGGGVLIAFLITRFFNITGLNAKIIILSSAMPSAVINFIVSHKYNVNSDLVASIIALTTLISIITTPLVLLWIM
ncbi:AEC family transporter [bacterium]|nr:MAG: AEC family transporter [bacterium]